MKLVCLGDSLTEGYQMDLSRRWTEELARSTDIEVINSGICGDTTAGMLSRFKEMVLDHQPTHLLILGGTNDMILDVPMETILSNIKAMTRYARYHGIEAVIGIPMSYRVDLLPKAEQTEFEKAIGHRIEHYRKELRAYSEWDQMPMIDFNRGLEAADYQSDGCHPNEEGHYKMMLLVKAHFSTGLGKREVL
jgi:lysophospholipase L1-like esterase